MCGALHGWRIGREAQGVSCFSVNGGRIPANGGDAPAGEVSRQEIEGKGLTTESTQQRNKSTENVRLCDGGEVRLA